MLAVRYYRHLKRFRRGIAWFQLTQCPSKGANVYREIAEGKK